VSTKMLVDFGNGSNWLYTLLSRNVPNASSINVGEAEYT
jgi:hypothetical protein